MNGGDLAYGVLLCALVLEARRWRSSRDRVRSPVRAGRRAAELDAAEPLSSAEVTALATVFGAPDAAALLLRRAGLAPEAFPAFTPGIQALTFWSAVGLELGHGRAPGGRRRLLTEAAALYPGNRVFR
ncbi:effector-associated domain EAD1-containing protein [Frankia torreyi]|nr:effector-associated domain EAD1-containing protein [Frankia torreyi]